MPIALAVHGGAWNIPDEIIQPSHDGVQTALERGWNALRDGASALDVTELVVRVLEDDSTFDAGRGSHLNREGRVEMDASIMEGSGRRAGAVAAIQGVRHPVSVARSIMDESPHVMLVGVGAGKFAREHSLPYPILLKGGAVMRKWGFQFIPANFLIDRSGRVVVRYDAIDEENMHAVERKIETLLN